MLKIITALENAFQEVLESPARFKGYPIIACSENGVSYWDDPGGREFNNTRTFRNYIIDALALLKTNPEVLEQIRELRVEACGITYHVKTLDTAIQFGNSLKLKGQLYSYSDGSYSYLCRNDYFKENSIAIVGCSISS